MNLLKLRFSMIGTLALIIGISTLILAIILTLIGDFNVILLAGLVLVFNLAQWLFAPYLINALYRVRKLSKQEHPKLHAAIEVLCRKINLKPPQLMLAEIPIPNAFAYGSPIAGSRVAVTSGLLNQLDEDEVEAVIGHELGHLKHKDVQIMMIASLLPALFYYIGYSLMYSGYRSDSRERGNSLAPLIGLISIAVYWILTLLALGLSRLREYYADQLSATTIPNGAEKLSIALAKIVFSTSRMKPYYKAYANHLNSFKFLLIADPDKAGEEAQALYKHFKSEKDLVQGILERKLTLADRVMELFSSHPNIVKRLKALQSYR
ncbi:M48 family metalloprotease [Candidatus Bathyarchaeota archaeon]|nr:M48 family metalloprotease [Candidatus Bathyarchaeota archaeon]